MTDPSLGWLARAALGWPGLAETWAREIGSRQRMNMLAVDLLTALEQPAALLKHGALLTRLQVDVLEVGNRLAGEAPERPAEQAELVRGFLASTAEKAA